MLIVKRRPGRQKEGVSNDKEKEKQKPPTKKRNVLTQKKIKRSAIKKEEGEGRGIIGLLWCWLVDAFSLLVFIGSSFGGSIVEKMGVVVWRFLGVVP